MAVTFSVNPATGLLEGCRQVLSPHWDARPAGTEPELIVVHGISLPPGEFGGPAIEQFFCGNLRSDSHAYFAQLRGVRVSAHLLVRRDGEVVQFVPFGVRAWHAGVSTFKGRSACNDFSIGVELEGTDELPYTDTQYQALSGLVRALCAAYSSLAVDRVVGHSDIAPGRKTDPGPSFDWLRLRTELGALTPHR